jgi:hypothetical protein
MKNEEFNSTKIHLSKKKIYKNLKFLNSALYFSKLIFKNLLKMKRNFLKEISFLLFVLLVLCVNFFAHCQNQVINLNSNWTIANKNRSVLVNSVELPATIHSVLINKKLISNPLTSFNASDNYKWIDEEEWLFENIFWINESTSMRNSFYELELNSIDTIAKVYLNDFFILFAQNQFVKYSIRNLNSKLREGSNRLLIEFKSPVKHSSVLSNLHPYDIPQKCVNKRRYNLECHINFIRKQQFSLGSVSFYVNVFLSNILLITFYLLI